MCAVSAASIHSCILLGLIKRRHESVAEEKDSHQWWRRGDKFPSFLTCCTFSLDFRTPSVQGLLSLSQLQRQSSTSLKKEKKNSAGVRLPPGKHLHACPPFRLNPHRSKETKNSESTRPNPRSLLPASDSVDCAASSPPELSPNGSRDTDTLCSHPDFTPISWTVLNPAVLPLAPKAEERTLADPYNKTLKVPTASLTDTTWWIMFQKG